MKGNGKRNSLCNQRSTIIAEVLTCIHVRYF